MKPTALRKLPRSITVGGELYLQHLKILLCRVVIITSCRVFRSLNNARFCNIKYRNLNPAEHKISDETMQKDVIVGARNSRNFFLARDHNRLADKDSGERLAAVPDKKSVELLASPNRP